MITSKLRAYRFQNGIWDVVTRWDLVKLSDVDLEIFRAKYFPLFISKSTDSYRLTYNSRQKTFRFFPNQGIDHEHNTNGLTISHQLAQEVLSEMEDLNLVLRDKRFNPTKQIKLQIKIDGATLEKRVLDGRYIVDLFVFFSSPADLALKWNGFIAIEVFATSAVDGNKIHDFNESKIPLIEITLGKNLLINKTASQVDEKEESNLRQYILNSFKKQIFADLLVSPTSIQYLEKEAIKELNEKISFLRKSLVKKEEEIAKSGKELNKANETTQVLRRKINECLQNIDVQQEKNRQLQTEIKSLKSRNTLTKILDAFKGN